MLVQPETWIASSGRGIVPGTVVGGHDADGDQIYVGRAYHEGDLLPAKVRTLNYIQLVFRKCTLGAFHL